MQIRHLGFDIYSELLLGAFCMPTFPVIVRTEVASPYFPELPGNSPLASPASATDGSLRRATRLLVGITKGLSNRQAFGKKVAFADPYEIPSSSGAYSPMQLSYRSMGISLNRPVGFFLLDKMNLVLIELIPPKALARFLRFSPFSNDHCLALMQKRANGERTRTKKDWLLEETHGDPVLSAIFPVIFCDVLRIFRERPKKRIVGPDLFTSEPVK